MRQRGHLCESEVGFLCWNDRLTLASVIAKPFTEGVNRQRDRDIVGQVLDQRAQLLGELHAGYSDGVSLSSTSLPCGPCGSER
jgi:hypothetical protein